MSSLSVEERLAALEQRAEAADAWRECLALVVKYETWHHYMTAERKLELFALTMPDVCMTVSCWGSYVGKEALEYLFGTVFKSSPNEGRGSMWIHCVDSPIIEVAKDGKTAKGLFFSPGAEAHWEPQNDGKVHSYWCWGRYSIDFIKENGVWKIWHMRWWRMFRNDFYKSWADAADETARKAPFKGRAVVENTPHAEPVPIDFFQPYHPDKMTPVIPIHPEPYETWEEGSEDWPYGEWKDHYVNSAEKTPVEE